MRSSWKQVRYRLEFLGCSLVAAFIPRLPRRVCLRLSRLLGVLYYRFDRKTRAVALENLRLALGDRLDAQARERVARASFRNFARSMLDLFWARNFNAGNYAQHLEARGVEHVREVYEKHGSIIFLTLHYGSYECVSLISAFMGMPISIVTLDFKNPSLDAVFREARGHSGNRFIGQQQSMLKLLRAVRQRGGAGLLVDLALRLERPGVVIDALGMKMYATFLHALLHARTGVPMVPATNVPNDDGTSTVTFHPPMVFPPGATYQEIAQGCWDFFEPFIRARPDLWLWSYRHWRYKPSGATREYPFYANVASQFDQAVTAADPERANGAKTVGAPDDSR